MPAPWPALARPWLQLSPTPVFTALASIFQVLLCPNPDLLLLSLLLLLPFTLPSTLSWGPGSENCLNLGPGNYPMRNGKFSSPGSHCSSKLRGGQRTRKGLTRGPHTHHSSHAWAFGGLLGGSGEVSASVLSRVTNQQEMPQPQACPQQGVLDSWAPHPSRVQS